MPQPGEGPSIGKTIDPKMTVTNADQKMALDRAFDDVFGSLGDSEPGPSGEPPKAPETKPSAQQAPPETEPEAQPAEKPSETEPELPFEEEPEEAAQAPRYEHPDDEPDEEADKYKIHADSKPETVATFKELRGAFKNYRKANAKLREELAAREAALKEAAQARPVSDPAVQKELTDLRAYQQQHQIFDDSAFEAQYEIPIRQTFDSIISDVRAMATSKEDADAWERDVRATPGLGRDYWERQVIDRIGSPLARDQMTRKVAYMLGLKEQRDALVEEIKKQPDRYRQYRSQQAAEYWKNFAVEAEDEARKIQSSLGTWAVPKDLALARNSDEKAAFERHNARQLQYEELFKGFLQDAAGGGPRGQTRVAAQAVAAAAYKSQLDIAAKRMSKLRSELDAARSELKRIADARARVSQPSGGANGQPPPAAPSAKKSLNSAFDDFFGKL